MKTEVTYRPTIKAIEKAALNLKEVALKLTKRCRASDIIARVGGEEFAFFGIDMNSEQAFKALNEFRTAVEEIVVMEDDDEIKPTISIGFATLDFAENFGEDLNTLVQRADEALYKAKENGRNRVEKYDEQSLLQAANN